MFWQLLRPILALLIVMTTMVASCSKKGSGSNGEDDGDTPYVIPDLRLAAVSDSTVTLTWTASGDDANQGTASGIASLISAHRGKHQLHRW